MRTGRRPLGIGLLIAALGALDGAPAGADEIEITIADGRVTLSATDAPLADVLAEWSRVGSTQFVDADDLRAGPVTLRLVDVAEADALRILLRPATGYLAAPRAAGTPGRSVYDRVKILAVRRAPRPATFVAPRFTPDAGNDPDLPPGFGAPIGPDGDPLAITPDEAAQLEQLQQLLQEPSLPDGVFPGFEAEPRRSDGADGRERTVPRPGMMVEDPETAPASPRGRGRAIPPQVNDPFTVFPQPPTR